jgi:hypothetical protein
MGLIPVSPIFDREDRVGIYRGVSFRNRRLRPFHSARLPPLSLSVAKHPEISCSHDPPLVRSKTTYGNLQDNQISTGIDRTSP